MSAKRTTPAMLGRARALRHALTPAEQRLWPVLRALRAQGFHFRRQHAIGRYVADFCSPRDHLIIELDGSEHLDRQQLDDERTTYLAGRGYRVLRFWNNSVLNDLEGVVKAIVSALNTKAA